jgi:hypothetical protein
MKFKYITLLFLFSVSTLSAQTYQIFRTTGSVTHYHNKQWAAAQRRATVLLSDSINIDQNSSCTLLNTQNNQLIDLKNSGKYQAKKSSI